MSLTEKRDDVYLEYITLNNMLGNHLEAQQDLAQRKFHPWEGGEGKVPGQYLLAQTELAKSAIKAGKYQEAIDLLAATTEYPHNLGEGKLPGAQENDIDYYRGIAYQALGNQEKRNFTSGKPQKDCPNRHRQFTTTTSNRIRFSIRD